MSNPSKEKGTRFESDIVKWLRASGWDVWRMAQTGQEAQGAIGGLADFAIEARNRKKLELAKNVDDANDRARCKGAKFGVTIMKRQNRPTEDAYVAMDLATFGEILLYLYETDDSGFCAA